MGRTRRHIRARAGAGVRDYTILFKALFECGLRNKRLRMPCKAFSDPNLGKCSTLGGKTILGASWDVLELSLAASANAVDMWHVGHGCECAWLYHTFGWKVIHRVCITLKRVILRCICDVLHIHYVKTRDWRDVIYQVSLPTGRRFLPSLASS